MPSTTARCNATDCRKKLKITDIECRCGFKFCSNHRHMNDHQCSVLISEQKKQKEELKKVMNECLFKKVDKI